MKIEAEIVVTCLHGIAGNHQKIGEILPDPSLEPSEEAWTC